MKRIRVLLVMFIVLSAFPFGLRAATYVVSNLADTGAGSLRQAIASANASGTDDSITFSANGTITLTSAELSYTAAQSLTITGNGEALTQISGGGTLRILDFGATAGSITIEQLTIKDGRRTDNLGGAGIHWENNNIVGSTLSLTYVTIKNCQSDDGFSGGGSLSDGGALLVSADIAAGYLTTLVVEHCTFDGNRTGDNGGAIWVDDNTTYGATVTISDSTFRNNSAWDDGAALYLENSMSTIRRCTIHANTNTDVGSRGAIHIQGGEAALINCTISDNQTVDDGGGIAGSFAAVIRLDNCTVTGNRTTDPVEDGGGGFYVNNSTIALHNTIVIGNTSASGFGDDGLAANLFIGSGIESQDYNLTGTATLSWNFLGAKANDLTAASAAAVLNPFLADNGGPVLTHALFVGSPAIAAAELTGAGGTATGGALLMDNATKLRVDARGFARAQGVQRGDSAPDIGAYEFSATLPHLAPAAPEIDVQRPASTSIPDGGTDNLGTQSTGTVSLTYTVDNSAGAAALQISTVTASGFSNVSGFTGPATTPFSVSAAGTTNFSVEFDIDAVGAFGLNLAIGNDDADEAPYNIAISGTGTAIASQTITFSNPGGQLTTNETSIAATASSGLPVTLSVLSGPATLSTNIAPATATYSATGQVSIVATQAGNGSFAAAPAITNTYAVSATSQAALSFIPTTPQTYNTTNTLSVTGGSGTGTVSYAVLSGPGVLTNTTGLYATSGTGSIVVQATKASDALYLSQNVSATVSVQKASQTITLEMLGIQVTTNVAAFVQVGSDIDGEAAGDSSGVSVSFSADGSRVAIGAPNNDGTGSDSGHLRVYGLSGTNWVQMGADIDGEAADDQFGSSVSLSADGNRVAIGATGNDGNGSNSGHVRVYDFSGTNWVQVGADIGGEAVTDYSGRSVSLSADGSRVAIGAYLNDGNGSSSGHVRVYGLSGTNWVQVGADIDGEAADDQSGYSVSLSADGSRMAIGATGNDGNGSSSGHVRVYDFSGTNWVQVGADIDGEAVVDFSGYSVSFSADGSRLAIGAILNDGNGSASGHVRVYDFSGTNWVQVGADIDGEAASDRSGYSVSLSTDGSRMAIGAQLNDGSGFNAGHVRVYDFSGTNWVQVGLDIDGEAAFDSSGWSVSFSADGSRLAIGATGNDGNGTDSGHVRVYDIPQVPQVSLTYSCLTTNTVALSATSDSGLPVTNFTANVPGLISGLSNLTFSATGTVSVVASQPGNANYSAAAVSNVITVLPAMQAALVFNPTSPQTYNTTNVLSVTGGSGTGAVSYAVLSGPGVITNTTGLYATSGTGSVVVQATKAADALYQSQSSSATVTVQKATQTITLEMLGVQVTTNVAGFVQLGSDIDGEAADDQSGNSISFSADGSRVAIGAPNNDGNGSNSGHIRVYDLSGTNWVQLGSDIDGEAAGDVSGRSVSLSADGSRVAIGATSNAGNGSNSGHVRVFDLSGTNWVQLGSDIDGEALYDFSGNPVSLSADGSRLAIGAGANSDNGIGSGHVRVYDLSGTNWVQVGADIDGEAGDYSAWSVSLSAGGSRVAIGSIYSDGNGSDSGHVRVYGLSGTNWVQVGANIDGETAGDSSGWSVSLSTDGSRVAIGSPYNAGNGSWSGHVRVYDFSGTNWVQVGADIDGEAAGDFSGTTVSLSADGSRVAIGATSNAGNGSSSGQIRVYDLSGTNWVQVGADIDGEAAYDSSGTSVSLSADGSRVAIGARYNDGVNGSNSGHVRVYDMTPFSLTYSCLTTNTIALSATSDSGLPVTNLTATSPGTISGGSNLTFSTSGTVYVAAFQLGDSNYNAAVPVTNAITVLPATQAALVFNPTTPQTYSTTNALSVTGGSGTGAVSYAVLSGPGVITNTTGLYATSGTGSIVVQATKAADALYQSQSASATVTVQKASQAISFSNPGAQLTTNETSIAATAGSGLPVSLSVLSGPAMLSTNIAPSTAIYSATGQVSIVATQAGSSNWAAAPNVTNTFTVSATPQATLVFNPSSPQTYNTTNALSTIGGSGTGAVSYAVLSGPGVITNTTGLYATSGTGSIVVQATKATDALYLVQSASATVTVQKASQMISFSNPGAQLTTNETSIAATAGSGLPVSLSVLSGPAMLSTNIAPSTATYSATGQVSIVATQAGNSNWLVASPVTNTFTVSATPQATLTFAPATPQTYNTTNTLSTTDGSGTGTVTYAVLSGPGVITNSTGLYATSGTGSIVVQATKAADVLYQSQTASATVTVQKATQAITLEMLGVQVTTNAAGFVQMGSDIDGEAADDRAGYSVSFSADGSRVAIGSIYNDGNGINSGHVCVYDFSGTNWAQVGSGIDGEAAGDQSGNSVSLSADGSRVAIGATLNDGNGINSGHVRVYDLSGTNWVQVGSDIDGEAAYDASGTSVSLSADGSRVAIGATGNGGNGYNSGHVRVYGLSGTNWVQVGADIDGEAADDLSGHSVSFSADGNRVAIGAYFNDGNGSNSGHVRVYDFNGTNWVQVGSDIDGEAAYDSSGYSVSLSADGSHVAIGASYNAGNGSASGHVRVYDLSGTNWVQVGSDIDGESANDWSGQSVSLSADGSRVAIGAKLNDGNGSNSGHVRVFAFSGTNWVQMGADIDGEAADDWSGYSVSLSADGSRVAIGAQFNDGNGTESGHVRMYEMTQVSLAYSCLTTNTVALSATSDSGLPVTNFTANIPGLISALSNLTFTATGTVSVVASQPGNANYSAAAVSNVITVLPATQAALVFSPTSSQTYNTTNALSVTGGSGTGSVSYAVLSGPGVITNTTGIYATSGTGSIVVQATKAADALYQSQNVSATVTVQKAAQTISFASPGAQLTTNVTSIAATAGSGLPVSLSVQSGPATLSTNIAPATLSYSATGTVSIVATQLGDSNWQSASPVTNTFAVSVTLQAPLVFTPTSPQTFNTTNTLSVTGGNGTGTVSYAVLSGPGVMTNTTGLYATSGTGSIVVQATKAADALYQSQSTSATVTVAKAFQSISFPVISAQFWTNTPSVSATAASGLPVRLDVVSGSPATVIGPIGQISPINLAFSGYGDVRLAASQAGDADWQAAPTVTNTFSVVGPQLVVLGTNGAVVVSSNAVSTADGTHFGEAIIGLEPVTNVFVITNAGNATLTVSTLATNGPQVSSFSLQPSIFVVEQGGTTNVTVVFDPQIGGSNSASFVFSFDGTNSPYTVNVAGVGLGGGIALSTNVLSFGGTYQGIDPSSQSLAMDNVGLSSLSWTNTIAYSAGASDWLSVLPNTGIVATNGQTSLTNAVRLTGVSAGTYTATVSIVAADATNSPQTYAVSLTVAQAANTISFANPGLQIVTNQTPITATASSGLPVSLQVVSGSSSLSVGTSPATATYADPGLVTLRAIQAGNGDWQAASSVDVTFRVRAVRVPYADFDGDGHSDISVFHQAVGDWHIIKSTTGYGVRRNWGWSETVPVPDDYDGDGQVDLAVYHQSSGDWYIIKSTDGSVRKTNWGWSETQPVPADYDGDRLADLAVYHQASGNWYIIQSSDGSVRVKNWGNSAMIPVPGDYDGDQLADLAVYHQASGDWYIIQSSDGSVRVKNWGNSAMIPVPGDYDGDGQTDLAVYHQALGDWYIIRSSSGNGMKQSWGWSATFPVPGDYDGDGLDDLAVYYPTEGRWYIINSSTATVRQQIWSWNGALPPWPAWR